MNFGDVFPMLMEKAIFLNHENQDVKKNKRNHHIDDYCMDCTDF